MMLPDEKLKSAATAAAHNQYFLRQQPKAPTIDRATAHAALVLRRAIAKMTSLHVRKLIEVRCQADGYELPGGLDELVHAYLAHAGQLAALASEATTVSYWIMTNLHRPIEDLVKDHAFSASMTPLPEDAPFELACPRHALLAVFDHLSAPTRAPQIANIY